MSAKGWEMKICHTCKKGTVPPNYNEGDKYFHDGCYIEYLQMERMVLNDKLDALAACIESNSVGMTSEAWGSIIGVLNR